jgi:hypothetical protein
VPRADRRAEVALERGKPERLLALVAEDELDAGGAKTARAVVEQQRAVTA